MDRGRRGRWKKPRSKVWDQFTRYTADDGKMRSKCMRCGKEYAYDGGTTNMLGHLAECGDHLAPQDQEMQQQLTPIHGPGLEEGGLTDLVRMIALHGYHPSVVEDEHFRSFVRHLDPGFKLPTRQDIEKACDTFCNLNLPDDPWQQIAPGASNFTIGAARCVEAGEVLYIICNFIDDEWKLNRLVDHAYLVLPPGDQYNASASLLGVPVVSAEVAAQRVVSYVLAYEYYPLMVAGEMTGGIGHLELKQLMDQKLRSIGTKVFSSTHMDQVFHCIARSLLPNADLAQDIFSNVLDLKWAREDRQRLLSELGLDDPLESSEQWYWCYSSMMMADHEHPLTLDSQKLLCNLWREIYTGIKRLSASSAPTSHICLEELLKVRGALQSQLSATSAAYLPLAEALEIVDKAIEDSYQLWSVPLVLDPRYKMRHIEEQFQKSFDDSKAAVYTSQARSMIKELYSSYNDPSDDDSDDFDEDMMAAEDEGKTELDEYLEDSLARTTEGMDFDILNWWKVSGSVQYPSVARLARAALAMPTCSKLSSAQTGQVKSIIRGFTKI